jgi:hypothetical protein
MTIGFDILYKNMKIIQVQGWQIILNIIPSLFHGIFDIGLDHSVIFILI